MRDRESGKPTSEKPEKVQELRPPHREKITQGQQFDEMQRQEKDPDGKPQK